MRAKKEGMVKKLISITEAQNLYLQNNFLKTGMSETEFLRRIIDQHIINSEHNQSHGIIIRENDGVTVI